MSSFMNVCYFDCFACMIVCVWMCLYGYKYLFYVDFHIRVSTHVYLHIHIYAHTMLIFILMCVFVCFHVYVVLIIHKLMKYFEKYIYLRNLYMLNYNMSILHTSISTFKKTCLEIISFEISLKQIKSFNFLTVFSCNPVNLTIWPWYLISLFSDYTFASFSSFSFLWHISLNAVCYNQNLKKI